MEYECAADPVRVSVVLWNGYQMLEFTINEPSLNFTNLRHVQKGYGRQQYAAWPEDAAQLEKGCLDSRNMFQNLNRYGDIKDARRVSKSRNILVRDRE